MYNREKEKKPGFGVSCNLGGVAAVCPPPVSQPGGSFWEREKEEGWGGAMAAQPSPKPGRKHYGQGLARCNTLC